MTETELKMLYDKKPHIELGDETFGMILQIAVMYALGRMPPLPGIVINYIAPLVPYISRKSLVNIQEQIQNHLDFYDIKTEFSRDKWITLHVVIGKELKKRGEYDV